MFAKEAPLSFKGFNIGNLNDVLRSINILNIHKNNLISYLECLISFGVSVKTMVDVK